MQNTTAPTMAPTAHTELVWRTHAKNMASFAYARWGIASNECARDPEAQLEIGTAIIMPESVGALYDLEELL